MKKLALITLCLLLLTSCNKTDVAVVPEQTPDAAPVVSSDATHETEEKEETSSSNEKKEAAPSSVQPKTQTVSIVVCGLDGEVMFSSETEWRDGITAFDILLECAKEKNIPVAYSGSKSSAYITSIGGLAEKQHGGMSGWIYTLNGESIMTPCGKCVLSPGDSVEFKYITEF